MDHTNRQYPWAARIALCVIVAGAGLFLMLSYLGYIYWPPIRPGRHRAIFTDPYHWQIFSIGLAFFCAGISFVIPKRWIFIGKLCGLGVVGGLLAGIIGSFLAR